VPFRFTGTIEKVTIELKDAKSEDLDAAAQADEETAVKKGLSD
jgi:hypothetical protein